MAEARLAVGFHFGVDDDGDIDINFNYQACKMVLISLGNSLAKKISTLNKALHSGFFPITPLSLGSIYVGFLSIISARFLFGIHFYPALFSFMFPINSIFFGFLAFLFWPFILWSLAAKFLQLCIRKSIILSVNSVNSNTSRTERTRNISYITVFLQKLLVLIYGKNFKLYSFQNCLPLMPVPSLDDTLKLWLNSVKPIYDDEKYEKMVVLCEEFKNGVGKTLQKFVQIKSWVTSNYVTDWWEKYIYLSSQVPIVINSNYYALDRIVIESNKQTSRAANVICCMLDFKKEIYDETLKPILYFDSVPLCSSQYTRCFNTSRIPGMERDYLKHYPDNDIVIIWHKGRFYKLNCSYNGKRLSNCDIEHLLSRIVSIGTQDNVPNVSESQLHLGALTSLPRDEWARIRKDHFNHGINRSSLEMINKSAFFVVLDDDEVSMETPDSLTEMGRKLMHGKGYDRWFDKSFTLVVFKNGYIGANCEHSWADAPIVGQLFEYTLFYDVVRYGYNNDGTCKGSFTINTSTYELVELKFDMNSINGTSEHPMLTESIQIALQKVNVLIKELDLIIMPFTHFGKGLIKTFKSSPDAFIQLALQMAYYYDIGNFDLTYESSMTRLFRDGRTETIRACSLESCDFIRSLDCPDIEREKKLIKYRSAISNHVSTFRASMVGKGCDRHLFCLYVASRALGYDVPFLYNLLKEPWRLSTSQTPLGMAKLVTDLDKPEYATAGGGFGPVADDGYGVSYIIFGENRITFHVSSKKTSKSTNSARFAKAIELSLLKLKDFLQEE